MLVRFLGILGTVVLTWGLPVMAQLGLDLRVNFGPGPSKVDLSANTYLKASRDFAETMIAKGRNSSGVFNEVIKLPDYSSTGSNRFGNDQNVYRLMYSLSYYGGDAKYREAADGSYAARFTGGKGPMPQGEGSEGQAEHSGVPALMVDYWRVNPDRLYRGAYGYWDACVFDKEKGNFNRHCGTTDAGEFPRHGVFFTMHWMQAFARTADTKMLEFIEKIYAYFETVRSGDALRMTSKSSDSGPAEDIQQIQTSVDSWIFAPYLPKEFQDKIKAFGLRTDKYSYTKVFPTGSQFQWEGDRAGRTAVGATRLWQLLDMGETGFVPKIKEGLIQTADLVVTTDNAKIGWAGIAGHSIDLLLIVHGFTGESKYLERAKSLADYSLKTFFVQPIPLTCVGSFCAEDDSRDMSSQYNVIGRSSANSGVSALPLALFQLGMILAQPDTRLHYPNIDR